MQLEYFYRGDHFYWRGKPAYLETDKRYHMILYRVPLTMNGIRNLNFNLKGTDYIGNCKSIYHMITTTPEPYNLSDFIMNYILHTKHYFDLSFMDKIYVMSYL